MSMKALSLFSGIGGIDLAAEWVGIETVAFCEREPFCQKVLAKHWPNVPIYDDVCTLTKERLEQDGIGTIELIHGGYPCQPFSHAGKREGADDDRHLWPEYLRLVKEIRPRWVVGENVAGHISLGLDIVLSDLESEGYAARAFVIPAAAVNARHRRDRVFIVAYSESWREQKLATGDNRIKERRQAQERHGIGTSGGGIIGDIAKRIIFSGATSAEIPQNVADTKSIFKRGLSIGTESAFTGSPFSCKNASSPSGWDQWSIEPDVGRVANGVPHRMDRLKGLGNAVVPQQIYPILAAIKQIDDMLKGESA